MNYNPIGVEVKVYSRLKSVNIQKKWRTIRRSKNNDVIKINESEIYFIINILKIIITTCLFKL